jgi:hypothetical protein
MEVCTEVVLPEIIDVCNEIEAQNNWTKWNEYPQV